MSNPTLLVAPFNSSLAYTSPSGAGVFTGVDPIRYDAGLWVEEGTTNLFPNPITELTNDNWGTVSGGVATRVTSESLFGSASIQFVSDNAAVDERVQPIVSSSLASPRTFTESVYTKVSTGSATLQLQSIYVYTVGLDLAQASSLVTTEWARMTPVTLAMSDPKTMTTIYASIGTGAIQQAVTLYATGLQIEEKDHVTSLAVGSMGDGYSWGGVAHVSESIRAASSASLTMDEPVSVACWYREGYSGAKQFAYLSPLGALGDDGDISYAAGDLTISTATSLVIGPFAAFDRELTTQEQANLARTQSWTLSTVLGRNPYINFQLRPY
jgi:hypothetical protein